MTGDRLRRLGNVEMLPYLASMVVIMTAFHLYLAFVSGGVVDLVAAVLLTAAAVAALVGYLRWRARLQFHAFSLLIFHLLSFVIVVGSVSVHAFATSPTGANYRVSGGLVWLVALWTIGLFVHALAANSSRGFDGLDA